MWGVLIAFGLVGGLVKIAYHEALDPVVKPAWQRQKLDALVRIPTDHLTLDQAEDGVVLSRRLGEPAAEKRFASVAQKLRRKRVVV